MLTVMNKLLLSLKPKESFKRIDFKVLNGKRLLSYHKAENARFGKYKRSFWCDLCWEYHKEDFTEQDEKNWRDWSNYIKDIKFELKKRGLK